MTEKKIVVTATAATMSDCLNYYPSSSISAASAPPGCNLLFLVFLLFGLFSSSGCGKSDPQSIPVIFGASTSNLASNLSLSLKSK
jgi:hypothetical protein